MFSEYASKFLAQSQSRFSIASLGYGTNGVENNRHPLTNQLRLGKAVSPSRSHRIASRADSGQRRHSPRASGPFGLGSRQRDHAPLFQSAAGLDEADEEEEHEKEVADYFALQRSRKHFVPVLLEESSEVDGDDVEEQGTDERRQEREHGDNRLGIRSSWLGDATQAPVSTWTSRQPHTDSSHSHPVRLDTTLSSVEFGRDKMSQDLHSEMDPARPLDRPNSSQSVLQRNPYNDTSRQELGIPSWQRQYGPESDMASRLSLHRESTRHTNHDRFWAQVYTITLITFLTSFVAVWLHNSSPSRRPLGDTIHTAISSSHFLLTVDTFVAIVIAMLWLTLLRFYARSLVYTVLVAAPLSLIFFSFYPFISSFTPAGQAPNFQDRVLRWISALPFLMAILWIYGVYRLRRFLLRAISILELAVKILAANPALFLVAFGTLMAIVVWTWLWVGMFSRVFLGGHFTGQYLFIIDTASWWLGAFYVIIYLWTLSVVSGIQRAATAATVSQWYFHRLETPVAPSHTVVRAALSHAMTSCFGSICLSTLIILLLRLPVLLLPRRMTVFLGFCSAAFLPTNLILLTHPTTLTYAAIHSQPLVIAARGISQLTSLSTRNRSVSGDDVSTRNTDNMPYKLVLLLLYATRFAASFSFGFGAWVHAARGIAIDKMKSTYTGSLYAYIVGLIASVIGWTVIGAAEGILTSIIDAVVICWESEIRGGGEARYCKEAEWLLGDDGRAEIRDQM